MDYPHTISVSAMAPCWEPPHGMKYPDSPTFLVRDLLLGPKKCLLGISPSLSAPALSMWHFATHMVETVLVLIVVPCHMRTEWKLIKMILWCQWPHSNAIKPTTLDGHHKFARVHYAISIINCMDMEQWYNKDIMIQFILMRNAFFSQRPSYLCILCRVRSHPTDQVGTIVTLSRSWPFVRLLARPRHKNTTGLCTPFDGKIGLRPFLETVVALKGSVHCPAGVLETKPAS